MLTRRKKLAALAANYDYSESDGSVARGGHRAPHEAAALTAESPRLSEERLHPAEDERKSKVLDGICKCLDKAIQACQKAAGAWLIGEGCTCRVVSITASMMDAVHKISAELDRPSGGEGLGWGSTTAWGKDADHPPEGELPHKAGPAAASAPAGNDTRF